MDYQRLFYPWEDYVKDTNEKGVFTKEAEEEMSSDWNTLEDSMFGYILYLTM